MNFSEHLHTALDEQRKLLKTMTALLEEEQRWIVELHPANLQGVTERKEETLEELGASKRRLADLLSSSGGKTATVTESLSILPESDREAIRSLQKEIFASAAVMEEKLTINSRLLERSLGTINHSLKFFVGMLKGGATYGQRGTMQDGANHSRILCKEI